MQVHAGQTTSARNSTRHSQTFTVERCAEMLAFWSCLLICSCLHLSRHAITHSIWSTIRSRCHNPTLVCCTLLGNYLYHPHNARISYSTSTLAARWQYGVELRTQYMSSLLMPVVIVHHLAARALHYSWVE